MPTPVPPPTAPPKERACSFKIVEQMNYGMRVDTNCDGKADLSCSGYEEPEVHLTGADGSSGRCFYEYRANTKSDATHAYDLQKGINPRYDFNVSEPVQTGNLWIVRWSEPGSEIAP